MNEKRSALFTIIVIASVIVVFTAADLIQKDRLFSETENRVLAARPEFSLEALLREDYTEKYEAYLTDQFVSRDKWVAIKTYMDLALQEKEIGPGTTLPCRSPRKSRCWISWSGSGTRG